MSRKHLGRVKRSLLRTLHGWQGKQYAHFLHIPKTGGTALRHALQDPSVTDKYVIKLRDHNVQLRDVPEGDLVFFVLRDPVSRFVSGFFSRQRQGRPRYFFPWSSEEQAIFEEFDSANKLALALTSENETEKSRAIAAMQHLKYVALPYWFWFEDEAYFLSRLPDIIFIGYQESLDEDFLRLKQKLGLRDDATLPDDDRSAHRTPAGIDRSLEPQALRNLKDWYADDYEFIALCGELGKTNDL